MRAQAADIRDGTGACDPSRQSHKKAAPASRLGGFFVSATARTQQEQAGASAGQERQRVKQNQIDDVNKALNRQF
jgi:hypothetical protein